MTRHVHGRQHMTRRACVTSKACTHSGAACARCLEHCNCTVCSSAKRFSACAAETPERWDYSAVLAPASSERLVFEGAGRQAGTPVLVRPSVLLFPVSGRACAGLPGFTRSVYARDHALIAPESRVWQPSGRALPAFYTVKHAPAPPLLRWQAGSVLRAWGCPGLQRQRIGGVPDIAHRRHGRQLCDAPGGARAGVCRGAAARGRGAVRPAPTRLPA